MMSPVRRTEQVRVPAIRFLCEQDGPPERILKERISHLLSFDSTVNSAYLVKVEVGTRQDVGVVLAIGRQSGADPRLVEKVGEVFASVFNGKEHLDIMFLDDAREAELATCCKPFFRAG
jgi:hypothetical protein